MNELKDTSDNIVQLIYTNNEKEIKLTTNLIYENDKYIIISRDNQLPFENNITIKEIITKTKIKNYERKNNSQI